MSTEFLSKSLYLRGLQCPKSLYLRKRHPEIIGELLESAQARLAAGTNVGILAQGLFPDGQEIPYRDVPFQEQIAKTEALIQGGADVLYEPAFFHDGVFVKVDILRKVRNKWNIYEVKSTTEVKDIHIQDGAIQAYVVKGAGLPLSNTHIVHIDNTYVKKGAIEPKKLFSVVDITDDISGSDESIRTNLKSLKDTLRGKMPDVPIGKQCSDPYDCDYEHFCWKDIPDDSIFDLRGRGIDRDELYRNGVVLMRDIPLNSLNENQRFQVEATLGKKVIVDKKGVKTFLDSLWYPLCYLDFETCMSAIPLFDGTRPYQQIPFQFSLHIQESEGAPLIHQEYLAHPNGDPRGEFLERLLQLVPPSACILTYNQAFEATRMRELRDSFPNHAGAIDQRLGNMRDLMIPFKKRTVYHWQMKGSYSIKEVLPALVPDLSYKHLKISDGGMAMEAYFAMCGATDAAEIESIREDLLEYCKLDTEAMVRIVEKLKTLH